MAHKDAAARLTYQAFGNFEYTWLVEVLESSEAAVVALVAAPPAQHQ